MTVECGDNVCDLPIISIKDAGWRDNELSVDPCSAPWITNSSTVC